MVKHKIEINIPSSESSVITFINHCATEATKNGVTIYLENKKLVKACRDCDTAHGLFIDVPKPELHVACDNPFDEWFPVLVHESSHMDQWIEAISLWDEGYVMGIDSNDIFDLWLNHKIELTAEQKQDIIHRVRDIEVDAEQRAVQKIHKFDLPINVIQYIQKANAYAYYYTVIGESRHWPEGPESYEIDAIWTAMPCEFKADYNELPEDIRQAFRCVLPNL